MWGTTRTLVRNMVTGVSHGLHPQVARDHRRRLSRRGPGQDPAAAARLQPRRQVPDPRGHHRSSARSRPRSRSPAPNKQRVGQVAAEIRAFRKPEPYKGKGIKYRGEKSSSARKARRSRTLTMAQAMITSLDRRRAARALPAPGQVGRPAAALGVPLGPAHLCPGHRRRAGRHPGRRLEPREGAAGRAQDRRRRRGGQGGRQADRRAGEGGRRQARSSSTAAATCFMAGSRPWPMPPARAACPF